MKPSSKATAPIGGLSPAVGYDRVSSREQEEEGFSIAAQAQLRRDYAARRGFRIVREFVDVETAKDPGRSHFNDMLRFLRRSGRTCRVILVEKTDRLYRNIRDWVTVDELGVDIHFIKEGMIVGPESSSSDKLFHGIRVLMAKNYVDNLGEEARKGMTQKALEGLWPTKAPLGYRNVEQENHRRVIEPDPETAAHVRELFAWFVTGRYSLEQVSRMARDAGFRYRTGATLAKSTIHKILRNPLYQGDVVWKGKTSAGVHEALVSRAMWAEVQAVLDRRPGAHARVDRSFPFQGLVSCAHCGCALTAEIKKGRYVYYHCTGYRGKCGEPYVRQEALEAAFTDVLGGFHLPPDLVDWLTQALRESHADERKFHDEAIRRLQREYEMLQKRLDGAYLDKLDGRVSAEQYDRLAATWRDEQTRLLASVHDHQNANRAYLTEGAHLVDVAARAQALFAAQPPDEKRKLLAYLLSNCTWGAGALTPTFRQPFDLIWKTNQTTEGSIADQGPAAGGSGFRLPDEDSNLEPTG